MKSSDNGFKLRSFFATVIVIFMLVLIGIAYIYITYYSQSRETEVFLDEITSQSAQVINKKMMGDIKAMKSFAISVGNSKDEVDDIVRLLKKEYTLNDNPVMRIGFVNTNGVGYAVSNGNAVNKVSIGETEYFKKSVTGKINVTETFIDSISNEAVNVYSIPVYDNSKIVGVHTCVNKAVDFENLLAVSYFNDEGFSFIVNDEGKCVVDTDMYTLNSDETERAKNKLHEDIASKIDNGKKHMHGVIVKAIDGVKYWVNSTPLEYEGWNLVMVVPCSTINQRSNYMIFMSVAILIIIVIISIILLKYLFDMKKSSEQVVYNLAYIDELTGIWNKNGFELEVERILHIKSENYAMIYFDIDNFKMLNDVYGYEEGDLLLRYTAKVISDNLRTDEVCGRLDGDNLMMLIRYEDNQEIKGRVMYLMDKISSYDFSIDNKTRYDIIVYCGIYKISRSNWNKSVDFLLDRTKMSMMRVVKKHKNAFAFYNDEVRKNIVFETELENDMRKALKNGEFKVYIQPKHNVKTGEMEGAEALVRWEHPEKGLLTPDKFIHIFERNGFVVDIDAFVFEEICRKQKQWLDEGYEPIKISVNQSRLHLYRTDYIESLVNILNKYELPSKYIELEITENMVLSSSHILADVIEQLHNVGFTVSMDDFGSGQSSLNILKDIDIDVLKIDRMFFMTTSDNDKGKKVITSVIDMANKLNIQTVSEGVETEEQFEFLKSIGCDYVQGYLFAKPMPMKEFEKKFKKMK